MSELNDNIQNNPEEKPLTEQELHFCELYVNGGLEYAGRLGKCYKEAFGFLIEYAFSAGYKGFRSGYRIFLLD